MSKSRFLTFLIIMFVFVICGLHAQANIPELRFGVRTNGTLPSRGTVWYSVTPAQDSFMVFELNSDDFDAYLEVYDANRELLSEDDDSGEGTNSKLEIYGVRGTRYLIKVRSYNNVEGGLFRIMASYKPAPRSVELRLGTARTGNLGRRDEHWYSVRTAAAGFLTVQTTGEDVDTILEAYDSTYKLLVTNDDGGEGVNARVGIITEPNQTYYFKLYAYDPAVTGSYAIIASFETIPEDQGNIDRTRALTMNSGDSHSGFFFTEDDERWFTFTVPRGGASVRIFTTGTLDTYIKIFNEHQILLVENDDSLEDYNAMISHRFDAGTYYINVSEVSGSIGPFNIYLY